MTPEAILHQCAQRGIVLSVNGDKLKVTGPPGSLKPQVVALLREHKADLLAALTGDDDLRRAVTGPVYEVPQGWSRERWIDRLEQLAATCESNVPARAEELREWARGLRNERVAR